MMLYQKMMKARKSRNLFCFSKLFFDFVKRSKVISQIKKSLQIPNLKNSQGSPKKRGRKRSSKKRSTKKRSTKKRRSRRRRKKRSSKKRRKSSRKKR